MLKIKVIFHSEEICLKANESLVRDIAFIVSLCGHRHGYSAPVANYFRQLNRDILL